MGDISIVRVLTLSQQREFLSLPRRIYCDYAAWIAPLRGSVEAIFNPIENPFFSGGDAVRFLAFEDGVCVGRIAAFYTCEQKLLAEQGFDAVGGCGFFECIDSQSVANQLFGAAKEWLAERNFTAMDGPINFGNRDAWWGLLVDGFEFSPLFENNYNPPYYRALFEGFGWQKLFGQTTYHLPAGGGASPLVVQRSQRLLKSGYEVRQIRRREVKKSADQFCKIYNLAWANFDDFKPLSIEHCRGLFAKMRHIIDPRLIRFAYHDGEAIGFSIFIPDINPLIANFNGQFGWWQQLQLMWKLHVERSSRRLFGVVFGVLPQYQGKGVESLLIHSLNDDLKDGVFCGQYSSLEFAWVGDFNPTMMRMMERFVCAQPLKRHITYRIVL